MTRRRTNEERIALIDEKIAKKQAEIHALEAQKEKILHPVTMKTVMMKAKESGLSAAEIPGCIPLMADETQWLPLHERELEQVESWYA